MPRVLDVRVSPFYAQVLVTTSPDAEHPMFVTGEEPAVASSCAIAISTIPDFDHEAHTVPIEVWVDEVPDRDRWSELFRGSLLVSAWGVAVSDVVGGEVHRADLVPGEYEAVVYGMPASRPATLRIVLTHA